MSYLLTVPYGGEVADTKSVRSGLREKEQVVREREAGKDYRARQKDKAVREL